MKKIILSILILSGSFLIAQDTLRTRKFKIGVFVSPEYSYSVFRNNAGINQTTADYWNTHEMPKFTYTVGAEILYRINNRFNLSLGLQYSVKGDRTKDYDLTNNPSQPGSGFVYTNYTNVSKISFKNNDMYMAIPFSLDIYINRKKIAPFITTGISTNIFLLERTTAHETFSDGHQTTVSSTNTVGEYSRVNLQYQLGAGVDIALKKSNLRIFPVYSILIPKLNSGFVNSYFYSIGLGINYLFRV